MNPLRSLMRALALAALALAYALVAPLALLERRAAAMTRALLAAAVAALLLSAGAAGPRPAVTSSLRVVTFNIRNFGAGATDIPRLQQVLAELDADVVAVQEIQDPAAFATVLAGVGHPGRRYAAALSACGGRGRMHVGFAYDAARVALRGQREFPELDPDADGSCSEGDRAGLLGEFAVDGRGFNLLVVHFSAGGTPERARRRRAQWDRALAIVAQARAHDGLPVALVGDANSTGFGDDGHGERSFILERVAAAGLALPTADVGCTEYYRPAPGRLEPSLLDHIATTPDFPAAGPARVLGYCAEARCLPLPADRPPADYVAVSDHCPVVVGR